MAQPNPFPALASLSHDISAAVAAFAPRAVSVFARGGRPSNGFVFDAGLVLTPAHAVHRDHDLFVRAHDGVRHAAVLAGQDAATNVAVLRVDTLPAVPASETIDVTQPGQLLLALARHPQGHPLAALCVVQGAGGPMRAWRGLSIERVLRLDRGLPPTFAGAPLVDPSGRLAGMVLAGDLRASGLAAGGNSVADIARVLAREGTVARGFLGVMCQSVRLPAPQAAASGAASGLLIVGVVDGGAASKAGVLVGDVLLRYDDDVVGDADDLQARLMGTRAGAVHRLTLLRAATTLAVEVTLGTREGRG